MTHTTSRIGLVAAALFAFVLFFAGTAHADIRPCARTVSVAPWNGASSPTDFSMYNTMSAVFSHLGR